MRQIDEMLTGIFNECETGEDFDGDKLMVNLMDGARTVRATILAENVSDILRKRGSSNDRFKW